MSAFLDLVRDLPVQHFAAGEIIVEQRHQTGIMYVLLEGEVEVLREDVRIAKAALPGVVFGEMSALLGGAHTATVRALRPSTFAIVSDPHAFLASSPVASLHVAELLARRLDALNKYLVDVKRQYEGHDHLGMVDEVLQALMHRHPRAKA
jgi:CRP/FNR family transcriptional regulator, cyclic AMP receptor protein